MDLDDIELFDSVSIKEFVFIHGNEEELQSQNEYLHDELQALALSIILSSNVERLLTNELIFLSPIYSRDGFQELLDLLLEDTGYRITTELLDQFQEFWKQDGDSRCCIDSSFHFNAPKLVQVEYVQSMYDDSKSVLPFITMMSSASIVIIENEGDNRRIKKLTVSNITQNCHKFAVGILSGLCFGLNDYSIEVSNKNKSTESINSLISNTKIISGNIFLKSPVYLYTLYIEELFDQYIWGWGYGGLWNENFELILVELLISVNEDLFITLKNMESMMKIIDSSDEISKLLSTLQNDIQIALTIHSPYAIGRLHQMISQLFESLGQDSNSKNRNMNMTIFMKIPENFKNSALKFIEEKIKLSPIKPLHNAIQNFLNILPAYMNGLSHQSEAQYTSLNQFISLFPNMSPKSHDEFEVEVEVEYKPLDSNQIHGFRYLRPNIMDSFLHTPTSSTSGSSSTSTSTISYLPIIPLDYIKDSKVLDRFVVNLSENLLMDVCNIESFMGLKIGPEPAIGIAYSAYVLMCLLNSGLSYVCSGG
eukprot:gene4689-9293_t